MTDLIRRVAVAGHPLCGKSTFARSLGLRHKSTDELLAHKLKWDELSENVSYWFDRPGSWVISGVAVPRALRKWRARHNGAKPPIDYFVFITRPSTDGLTPAQRSMMHGIDTVVDQLRGWLYPITIEAADLQRELQIPLGQFFVDHACWRCHDGAQPCYQRGYFRCEFPHARND